VFERFTERARQVVVLAQQEARELRHNYIGTEHILLGLLREEEGLAARVLESLDITVERVRGQVVRIVGSGDEVTSGQIPFTPRGKKVLELALRESLSLGHNYIGTEHILLALVRENEGVASRILLDFDADAETIRGEVRRLLSGPRGRRHVAQGGGPRRTPPHPLRPPFDWEHAGVLWRPDRLFGAVVRELEGATSRLLEQQFGLRVSRVRPQPEPRASTNRAASVRILPGTPAPPRHGPAFPLRGLRWERATFLWRPEGLELRVPLNLDQGAMAAFAADVVWETAPLRGLRREIWDGWLALASPTLLDELDPDHLRRSLGGAVSRALEASSNEPGRVEIFLRRLRGAATGPDVHSVRSRPEKRVADPDDASTLAGQFQVRCRDLIVEIIAAGFTPGAWIDLINSMGAVEATKHLLSNGRVLPVTPWLIEHGRPELTMEHEITQTRWAELFTDDERADAARRLARARGRDV
jgi:hypothetical protein